jgi:hypothetical protein
MGMHFLIYLINIRYALIPPKIIINIGWFKYVHIKKLDYNKTNTTTKRILIRQVISLDFE